MGVLQGLGTWKNDGLVFGAGSVLGLGFKFRARSSNHSS